MNKEETIKKIRKSLGNPNKGRNSMGCSESFYNPLYMVGSCFTEGEMLLMSESELNNLIKLADFASDVFY